MAKLVLKKEQSFTFFAEVTAINENNNGFNGETIESYRLKFEAFGGNVPVITPTKYKGAKFCVSGQIGKKPFQQKRYDTNGQELLDSDGSNLFQMRNATSYLGEAVEVSGAITYYVGKDGEVKPTLKISTIKLIKKYTVITPLVETELSIFPSLELAMVVCDVVETVATEEAKTPLEVFSGLTLLELQKAKKDGSLDAYLTQKGKDTMTSADDVKGFKKLAEAI